jgi:hypothetical protein
MKRCPTPNYEVIHAVTRKVLYTVRIKDDLWKIARNKAWRIADAYRERGIPAEIVYCEEDQS